VKLHELAWDSSFPDAFQSNERENLIRGAKRASAFPRKGDSVTATESELRMQLWALDVRVVDAAVLRDRNGLRTILYEAAQLGGATVVGEEFCVFPNGAVTGVLVLAQSHLSIHTWPERSLANVDLLSCGDLRGEEMLRAVAERIGAEHLTLTCVPRGPW
jgi:S-adenosylmethionine decarboxylase